MEVRSQNKEKRIMPISLNCSSSHQPTNQDFSSSPILLLSPPAAAAADKSSTQTATLVDHTDERQAKYPNPSPNPDPDPTSLLPCASESNNREPPPPPSRVRSHVPPTAANNDYSASIRYRECLKNHAANMGRHVVDGCGEFMPGGEESPMAFKCAACGCHRNFHRKEYNAEPRPAGANSRHPHNNSSHSHRHRISTTRTAIHSSRPPPPAGPAMMSFGGGGGAAAESSSEDLNIFQTNNAGAGTMMEGTTSSVSASKKRFRTKFSEEQKEKMLEFAERMEWKIQKQDEQEVNHFCTQVGVKRQVFKVWMHNNKQQAIKNKKQLSL